MRFISDVKMLCYLFIYAYILFIYVTIFISFTLYPAHNIIGREEAGNLMLRHCVLGGETQRALLSLLERAN